MFLILGIEQQTKLILGIEQQTKLILGKEQQTKLIIGIEQQTKLILGIEQQTILILGIEQQTILIHQRNYNFILCLRMDNVEQVHFMRFSPFNFVVVYRLLPLVKNLMRFDTRMQFCFYLLGPRLKIISQNVLSLLAVKKALHLQKNVH